MVKKMAVKKILHEQKNGSRLVVPKLIRPLIITMSVLSFLVAGWLLIAKMPDVWRIKKIAIVGDVEHVTQKQLADILTNGNGLGMLTIDLDHLRQKVMQLPWVKNVQIRKTWPDTLSFTFEEYQPIALINESYLMANGNLIERGSYLHRGTILNLKIDKSQITEKQALVLLVKKMQMIQEKLDRHQLVIENMQISESNSWSIKIENKFVIKIGRKQQLQRIEKFLQVYAAIEDKNKLESIDLRYSNGLAVKLSQKPAQNG